MIYRIDIVLVNEVIIGLSELLDDIWGITNSSERLSTN